MDQLQNAIHNQAPWNNMMSQLFGTPPQLPEGKVSVRRENPMLSNEPSSDDLLISLFDASPSI